MGELVKMERKIISNMIKTPDGTILESKSVHDYVSHLDKNGLLYFTDGGLEYLRRAIYEDAPYTDLTLYSDDSFDIIRNKILWGTYGKNGKEKLKYKKLSELSNNHIKNILLNINNLSEYYKKFFNKELKYRKENNINIEDD